MRRNIGRLAKLNLPGSVRAWRCDSDPSISGESTSIDARNSAPTSIVSRSSRARRANNADLCMRRRQRIRGDTTGHRNCALPWDRPVCSLSKFDLHCRDFAEALDNWAASVVIVWIGMSLHHLQSARKQRLMVDARSALRGSGILLGSDRPTQGQAFEAEAWNAFWLVFCFVRSAFLFPTLRSYQGTRLFAKWVNWVRA